jgi:hypothetical protein
MDAIELLRSGFAALHEELRADFAEVQADWLWWTPEGGSQHIGFILYHLVRDEDDMLAMAARVNSTWTDEGWAARLGLPPEGQGTGMERSLAAGLRYDLAMFLAYAGRVWDMADGRLATLTPGRLDEPSWPGSPWSLGRHMLQGCLDHSWLHLGEIRALMGQRGWRFRE